jgi:catalase
MEALPNAPVTAMPVQTLAASPALQLIGKMQDTLKGRTVGILLADGSDAASIKAVKEGVAAAGAKVKIIALTIGAVKLSDGVMLAVDGQLAGTPSVLFDAIAIILSPAHAARLGKEAAAIDFVRDAFGHLKAIVFDKGGADLLTTAGITADAGVIAIEALALFIAAAKTRQWDREVNVRTLA